MPDSVSERRLVENEVMSRKPNLKVSRDFDNLKRIAQEDRQAHFLPESDPDILFLCECSDEKCITRIKLNKDTYDRLHQSNKWFLLKPGHDIPSIERVIKANDDYIVVEKFLPPPKDATNFNPTDLNNSDKKS